MRNGVIAVIDSGIGGLSSLYEMIKLMPNERYVYFGDNKNAPYGEKSFRELLSLSFNNVFTIMLKYKIKALVVGCNTLSVTVLPTLKSLFDFPIFGTFPPVELPLIQNKKVLLMSTPVTAKVFNGVKNLKILPLKDLASNIEKNVFSLNGINIFEKKGRYFSFGENENLSVILGCTHYFFVKNKIFAHLRPLEILRSEEFTAKFVYKNIKKSKSLVFIRRNKVLFLGENSDFNRKVWKNLFKI